MRGKKVSWLILGVVFLMLFALTGCWPAADPELDPDVEELDPDVEEPDVEEPMVMGSGVMGSNLSS